MPQSPPDYPDHTRLSVVRGAGGIELPIESRADWEVRRAHILGHLQRVAGPLPGGERRTPLDMRVLDRRDELGLVRLKIDYLTEPNDRVSAWLFVPRQPLDAPPRPAVLCLHQTVQIGKDEPAGLGGKENLRYGRELARRGFITLSPDYPTLGERKVDAYALGYESMTMKGIWDHLRAVDLLCSRADVDPDRIGVIGHSLGGHNAIFAALFDPRLKAVVSSCGFNAFTQYMDGNIAGWAHGGYMPRLRSVFGLELDRVPFDFPELIGALAPKAFFTNSPLHDDNFAVEGVKTCMEAARFPYEIFGAADRLVADYPDAAHDFPPVSRELAYAFLDRHLDRGA